jgi:hypothetical protein
MRRLMVDFGERRTDIRSRLSGIRNSESSSHAGHPGAINDRMKYVKNSRLFRDSEGPAVSVSFEGGHLPFEGGQPQKVAPFEAR